MNLESAGNLVNELILEIFSTNGALISFGDALVADLSLTSATWQVLGVIAKMPGGVTMPTIAREMGLTRQGVRKSANRLVEDGLVRIKANPEHQRSTLLALTSSGRLVYLQTIKRQKPCAERMAEGIPAKNLQNAIRALRELKSRLPALKPTKTPIRGINR
jgi:DNA-binding MarR family transcriptional regulator